MALPKQTQYDITSFINQLQLSPNTQKRAEVILHDVERAGLSSRKAPESLIAAALYIACILEDERRTQKKISQVTGVSPSTIQTRYRQLVHELEIRSD
jgi:transcription initiation factor TFIIB